MQHSPQHEPVNVSDRSYFKRAMAGESGIEAVFNTRMTHENLVYFFAPVREGADGPVVGLLLAHYSENRARRSSVRRFLRLRVPGDAVLAHRGGGGRHGFLLCWQEPYPRGAGRPLCHLWRPRSGARFCQSRDGSRTATRLSAGTGSVCIREVPGLGWMCWRRSRPPLPNR